MSCGLPTDGSRKFQPVVVASGTATSGSRIPARSFPSRSILRDEMRKRNNVAADHACGPDDPPRIRDTLERGEPHAVNPDQGAIAQARILARRRQSAGRGPLVPGAKQRPHDVVLRRRIVQLLPTASRRRVDPAGDGRSPNGWKRRDDVLGPCQEIHPDVVRQLEIPLAISRRVRERRGSAATPVFDWGVRIENLRTLIRPIARLHAAARAVRIELLDVGKRKLRRREQLRGRLGRKPLVEADAGGASHVNPHCVEYAVIALVDVESFVEELSKESPRLRHAERIRTLPVDRQVGSIAERSGRITNRGEARASDERSGRTVGHAIVPSRLEARLEAQLGEIVGPDHETPALAWNHFALVPEAIANREYIRRALTVRGG